jgi:hypothetical protein
VYLLIAYHFKMSIAPAHAIALALPPDAAQNTAQFTYVQDILLLAPDAAHPINSCFKKYGFDTVHDLVAMTAEDVEGLEYDKFDGAGALANTLDVPGGYKFMIREAAAHIQDEEAIEKNRSVSRNVQVNAHDLQDPEFYDNYERNAYYHLTQDDVEHNIDTPIQDLQAFRAQQTFGKKKFFNRVLID